MEFWITAGVIWIICGLLSAGIASSKGRNDFGWFLIGFLFGPLGLLASVGMSDARRSSTAILASFDSPEGEKLTVMRPPSGKLIARLEGTHEVVEPLTDWESAQVEAATGDLSPAVIQSIYERLYRIADPDGD